MDPFLELLAQLESDIASLTVEELTEARDQIAAYGRELRDTADEAEDQEQLNTDALTLAAALVRIDAELQERRKVATEAAAARDEAFAAFAEDEEEDDAEAQGDTSDEAEAEEETEEAVTAAAPPLTEIAKRRPKKGPAPTAVETRALVAAAVGPSSAGKVGDPFPDSDAFAAAMWDAHTKGPRDGGRTVARLPLEHGHELRDIPEDNWSVLMDVQRGVQKARREGVALTAAGFCAPAEPVYSFFQQGSRDGLIDLPTVTARRGRLTYPEIFNIRDLQVEAGVAWETTSTMDEDAVQKPCFTIVCGAGTTFDVNAYSTCLTYSNFDSQFWPERVTHSSGQAMIAHDHEVSLALIDAIVADGRTTTVIDGHLLGGTWSQLSQSLALHGGFIRSRFRLPVNEVLEAVIPSFVLDALVADQVARDSTQTYGMARAEVEAAISRHRINVQWVYDWQELDHPNWPDDYDYLLFPAGVVVRLSGGTLDLGVTRDSTLNVANDFQIFTETFDGHAIIGSGVYVVTGVNLCPTGGTGNRVAIDCAAGS